MDSTAKFNEKFTIVREAVPAVSVESDSVWSEPPPLPRQCSSRFCVSRKESRRLRGGAEEQGGEGERVSEAQLCSAEMERALSEEKLCSERDRLRRLQGLLEAQALFAQSADLKARALARLTGATVDFARKDLPASPRLERALEETQWQLAGPGERFVELSSAARAAADLPDRLCQLMMDHREKKNELQSAVGSLQWCLRRPDSIPTGKCRRSEAEYHLALESYDRSCSALKRELSESIEDLRGVAGTCLSKLASLLETTVEQDKHFLVLWKELSGGFKWARDESCGSSL